jgi:enhancer of mRNA-decapping protein 4
MGDSTTEVDESEKRNGNQSYENGAGLESLVVKLEARDGTSSSLARRVVDIYSSRQSSVRNSGPASSSVRSHPIANQMWDQQYYRGCLVAWSSKYLAYALKGRNGPVIRVIDPVTTNRTLLKGMVGAVADLSFAGSVSDCLACVDEAGSLFVWRIRPGQDEIKADLRLYVIRDDVNQSEELILKYHRLMWCPQASNDHEVSVDDEDEDDGLPALAVTVGNLVWLSMI